MDKTDAERADNGDAASQAARALMADEEDDFFSNSGPNNNMNDGVVMEYGDEEGGTPTPTSGRGKKKRGSGVASRGGRKPGPKRGYRRKAAGEAMNDNF